jgi:hypothetical protein
MDADRLLASFISACNHAAGPYMKDGRTHLVHKAEHAVDIDSGAVVAVTLQGADKGNTTAVQETLG